MGYMAQDKGMGTALRKQRVYGKSQKKKRAIHGRIPLSSFVRRAAQGQKSLAASYAAQHSLRQTVQTPSLLFHPTPTPGRVYVVPRLYATLITQRKSLGLIYKRKSMAHVLCTMH